MRDPSRIDPLLAKLRTYWLAYPDMRLGQIVTNFSPMYDPFYVEDSEILANLDAKLAKLEPAPPVGQAGGVPRSVLGPDERTFLCAACKQPLRWTRQELDQAEQRGKELLRELTEDPPADEFRPGLPARAVIRALCPICEIEHNTEQMLASGTLPGFDLADVSTERSIEARVTALEEEMRIVRGANKLAKLCAR